MKVRTIANWNIICVIRLLVGIIGIFQGIMMKEFALSLMALLLVYMAVGDAEGNAYMVETKEANRKRKRIEYEKVDRVL